MSREAKWLVGFLCVIVAAFVAEHIAIFYLNDRYPAMTVDPAPPCRLVKP